MLGNQCLVFHQGLCTAFDLTVIIKFMSVAMFFFYLAALLLVGEEDEGSDPRRWIRNAFE